MTTTIKIVPAGHRVKVTSLHLNADKSLREKQEKILEPNTPEVVIYAHSSLSVLVEEVGADDEAKPSPIGSPERVVEDLKNYAEGKPTR